MHSSNKTLFYNKVLSCFNISFANVICTSYNFTDSVSNILLQFNKDFKQYNVAYATQQCVI